MEARASSVTAIARALKGKTTVKSMASEEMLNGVFLLCCSYEGRFDGLDKRLDGIDKRLDGIDKRLGVLEADVKVLKSDVKVLKSDVKVLKSDVKEIKSGVKEIMVYLQKWEPASND